MNSREKGKRGERQWRDELRANGFAARRGQQFSGSAESPDVVCDSLPWIHFEVKAVERLNIEEAMEQARRDCREKAQKDAKGENDQGSAGGLSSLPTPHRKVPIVAHRRNFCAWLVTMEAETFFQFLRGDFYREIREIHEQGTEESQISDFKSQKLEGAESDTNKNQKGNQNNESSS
jgi:hypothetical protein